MNVGALADRDWSAVEATYLSRNDQPYCVLDGLLSSQAAEQLREKLLNDHGWHFKHPRASRRAAFLDRLGRAEALAAERGTELSALSYEVADGLWREVYP